MRPARRHVGGEGNLPVVEELAAESEREGADGEEDERAERRSARRQRGRKQCTLPLTSATMPTSVYSEAPRSSMRVPENP